MNNRLNLTAKQARYYRAIVNGYLTGGDVTYQELATRFGCAKATAYEHVNELVKKRYIAAIPRRERSIQPRLPLEMRYLNNDAWQTCATQLLTMVAGRNLTPHMEAAVSHLRAALAEMKESTSA